jgi:hypothetical protein
MRKRSRRHARLAAVARESSRVDRDRIKRWQQLPLSARMNVLRKRVGPGRSAL